MTPEEIADSLAAAREDLGWTVYEVRGGYIVRELGNKILSIQDFAQAVIAAMEQAPLMPDWWRDEFGSYPPMKQQVTRDELGSVTGSEPVVDFDAINDARRAADAFDVGPAEPVKPGQFWSSRDEAIKASVENELMTGVSTEVYVAGPGQYGIRPRVTPAPTGVGETVTLDDGRQFQQLDGRWMELAPAPTPTGVGEVVTMADGSQWQQLDGRWMELTPPAPTGVGQVFTMADGSQWQQLDGQWREVTPAKGITAGSVVTTADGRQFQMVGNQLLDVTTKKPLAAGEVVTTADGRLFQQLGDQVIDVTPEKKPQIVDVDGRKVFTGPGQLLPEDRPGLEQQAADAFRRGDRELFNQLNTILNQPSAFQQSQMDIERARLGLDVQGRALDVAQSPGDWWTYMSRLYGKDLSQTPYARAFEAIQGDLTRAAGIGQPSAFPTQVTPTQVTPTQVVPTQVTPVLPTQVVPTQVTPTKRAPGPGEVGYGGYNTTLEQDKAYLDELERQGRLLKLPPTEQVTPTQVTPTLAQGGSMAGFLGAPDENPAVAQPGQPGFAGFNIPSQFIGVPEESIEPPSDEDRLGPLPRPRLGGSMAGFTGAPPGDFVEPTGGLPGGGMTYAEYVAESEAAARRRGAGGGMGGFTGVPGLARGTPSFQGGVALVGERGPELVQLPRGTRVKPIANVTPLAFGTDPLPPGVGDRGFYAPRLEPGVGDRGFYAPRLEPGVGDRGFYAPRLEPGVGDRGFYAPRLEPGVVAASDWTKMLPGVVYSRDAQGNYVPVMPPKRNYNTQFRHRTTGEIITTDPSLVAGDPYWEPYTAPPRGVELTDATRPITGEEFRKLQGDWLSRGTDATTSQTASVPVPKGYGPTGWASPGLAQAEATGLIPPERSRALPTVFGAEGKTATPFLSMQQWGKLLPSEQAMWMAENRARGFPEEDYMAQWRKQAGNAGFAGKPGPSLWGRLSSSPQAFW